MTKFINKTSFQVIEHKSETASELSRLDWAILIFAGDTTYTKSLIFDGKETLNSVEFDVCSAIVEMSEI